MNQQDINALTEFWHRETNYLNDSIDSAFKSAQDDAYARGHRRGREDLIDIRKQRDKLLAALEQMLDYMGDDGHCVCEAAKQQSVEAVASVKVQQ